MPGIANPQNLNRYSYVINNPLRYTDPTGHMMDDGCRDYGCGSSSPIDYDYTPGTNSNDDDEDDDGDIDGDLSLGFDTRDMCDYGNCELASTFAGLAATGLDAFAFGMNLTFMIIVDVSAFVGFPLGLEAALAAYKLVSPLPNIVGTMGGVMWAIQGALLGTNYVEGGVTLNASNGITVSEVQMSGAISQDTIVAGVLDGSSWTFFEPNSATVASGAGLAYDVLRNPLAPSFSSQPAVIPDVIDPSVVISYDFTSGSGSFVPSLFHR